MRGPSTPAALARSRRRSTAGWTTAAGLAVLAAAALVARSWRAELPDPVASHWGADGNPNGYSSLGAVLAVMLGMGAVLVIGFGAVTFWLGQAAWTRRMTAGATIWSALFIASITVGTLSGQRGLSDARDAGGVGAVVLVAIAGSLAAAVVVGAVVPGDPRQPTSEPVDPSAPRAPVSVGEHATWSGTAQSRAVLVTLLGGAALVGALVALTQLWALLIVVALLVALAVGMSSAEVHVDRDAVTIRSPIGWPRARVPLDEVVRADVTEVRPLRDFGGWGWRVGRGGRVGVALRAGEALVVERTGGRSIVITIDHALGAAGTINALVDRVRR